MHYSTFLFFAGICLWMSSQAVALSQARAISAHSALSQPSPAAIQVESAAQRLLTVTKRISNEASAGVKEELKRITVHSEDIGAGSLPAGTTPLPPSKRGGGGGRGPSGPSGDTAPEESFGFEHSSGSLSISQELQGLVAKYASSGDLAEFGLDTSEALSPTSIDGFESHFGERRRPGPRGGLFSKTSFRRVAARPTPATRVRPASKSKGSCLLGVKCFAGSSALPAGSSALPVALLGVKCDPNAKYRTIDGTCNNLRIAHFGSILKPYRRLLPAQYDDDFSDPRALSSTGSQLPSARLVSNKMHSVLVADDMKNSMAVLHFGQFLAHDIIHTPAVTKKTGPYGGSSGSLNCDNCQSSKDHCFPIPIPGDDTIFSKGTCMSFTRSLDGQASLGVRQQINQVTSYIDASVIYGVDAATQKTVRQHTQGKMKLQTNGLPPKDPTSSVCRGNKALGNHCFKAGDNRNSFTLGLASFHTLFLHEHNYIATELAKVKPSWNDEQLFQETRKIIGAEIQHLTYDWYLPKVLGPFWMTKFKLNAPDGIRKSYSNRCNSAIFNEFATAGFRFGHTQIADTLMQFQGFSVGSSPLVDTFFNPDTLYAGGNGITSTNQFLVGMKLQRCQHADRFSASAVHDFLLASKQGVPDGLDLFAIDIQRGRDHGLQPYINYRRMFGLSSPGDFNGLNSVVTDSQTITALKDTYKSVEDIDLFTGIYIEKLVSGGLVGETAANIIGRQFENLKKCDRFFYDNGNTPNGLTLAQVEEVKKTTTMRDLICRHVERVGNAPTLPILSAVADCTTKPVQKMDFSKWAQLKG